MVMVAVSMPAMHEDVHQRAGEQKKIGKSTQNVSAMLGEQQDTDDHQETAEDQASA
jgi:hypothetical protein